MESFKQIEKHIYQYTGIYFEDAIAVYVPTKYYFEDEVGFVTGPYESAEEAKKAKDKYIKYLCNYGNDSLNER